MSMVHTPFFLFEKTFFFLFFFKGILPMMLSSGPELPEAEWSKNWLSQKDARETEFNLCTVCLCV